MLSFEEKIIKNLWEYKSFYASQAVAAPARSKEARSFRGQNILEPGHPDALFFLKKVDDIFSRRSPSKHKGRQRHCFHCYKAQEM